MLGGLQHCLTAYCSAGVHSKSYLSFEPKSYRLTPSLQHPSSLLLLHILAFLHKKFFPLQETRQDKGQCPRRQTHHKRLVQNLYNCARNPLFRPCTQRVHDTTASAIEDKLNLALRRRRQKSLQRTRRLVEERRNGNRRCKRRPRPLRIRQKPDHVLYQLYRHLELRYRESRLYIRPGTPTGESTVSVDTGVGGIDVDCVEQCGANESECGTESDLRGVVTEIGHGIAIHNTDDDHRDDVGEESDARLERGVTFDEGEVERYEVYGDETLVVAPATCKNVSIMKGFVRNPIGQRRVSVVVAIQKICWIRNMDMRTGKRTKRAIMGSLDQAYLPNTYTTQSTPASREATVFYGDFDPEIVPLDFELRDFDTLGASISIPSHSRYVGSI